MDTVLIILGILGLGAMLIAAYVFTVSARSSASKDQLRRNRMNEVPKPEQQSIERGDIDRRRKPDTSSFPITVEEVVIKEERRHGQERRFIA